MSGADAPYTSDQCAWEQAVVRLSRRPQFLFVSAGHSIRAKSLVVQARKRRTSDLENLYIGEGFTATKKVGNAVIRNRAKRRLRAASARLLPLHGRPGFDYVFIARQQTGTIAWARLLDDMEKALISLASISDETSGQGSSS